MSNTRKRRRPPSDVPSDERRSDDDRRSEDSNPAARVVLDFWRSRNDWKSASASEYLAQALAKDQGEGRLDIGCIADYGTFGCEGSDCQTGVGHDKAVPSFLLELITKLQKIGAAPAIDMGAYAKWLMSDIATCEG